MLPLFSLKSTVLMSWQSHHGATEGHFGLIDLVKTCNFVEHIIFLIRDKFVINHQIRASHLLSEGNFSMENRAVHFEGGGSTPRPGICLTMLARGASAVPRQAFFEQALGPPPSLEFWVLLISVPKFCFVAGHKCDMTDCAHDRTGGAPDKTGGAYDRNGAASDMMHLCV